MNRAEYEASICSERAEAVTVPFKKVALGDWMPKIADCHNNVDHWVEANPGCEAVRGWITYISFGPSGVQLTSHSVVRDHGGNLFDITPVYQDAIGGGAFVEDKGDLTKFFAMKDHDIRCPSLDPEADVAALLDLIRAAGNFEAVSDLDKAFAADRFENGAI